MTTPEGKADWRESLRQAGPLVGLGMQMALTMVLFTGGGFLLDRKYDTMPWCTLAGAIAGIAMLFYYLFRLVRKLDGKNRG